MKKDKWTAEMVQQMIANPCYVIFGLIDRELWVGANENMMKEVGVRKWLNTLLDHLEESWPATKGSKD